MQNELNKLEKIIGVEIDVNEFTPELNIAWHYLLHWLIVPVIVGFVCMAVFKLSALITFLIKYAIWFSSFFYSH